MKGHERWFLCIGMRHGFLKGHFLEAGVLKKQPWPG